MRTSVTDSVTDCVYSSRVSCWTSTIITCSVLMEGVLLLYGPRNLGTALQHTGQKRVQVAPEDLVQLDKFEIAKNMAQDAIDFTQTAAGNRSFNGCQGAGRRL